VSRRAYVVIDAAITTQRRTKPNAAEDCRRTAFS